MSKFTNSPQFQMDDWKEIKKIAENLYKSREFEQAAQKYIKALENLMDSDCKLIIQNAPTYLILKQRPQKFIQIFLSCISIYGKLTKARIQLGFP